MALGGLGRSTKPSGPGCSLPALWEAQLGVLLPWLPAGNSRICSANPSKCPASSHSCAHGDQGEGQEMHEPVSNPGCGTNSQGQGADPHGGNLIEESLLTILEKKKKRRTHLPGADCTRAPRQGGQGAWHGAVQAARHIHHQPGGHCQFQSHQFSEGTLSAPPDSRALKPWGNSLSSRWTKITGSLGFILPGRPEARTNPSPLICNKVLQRQHHL